MLELAAGLIDANAGARIIDQAHRAGSGERHAAALRQGRRPVLRPDLRACTRPCAAPIRTRALYWLCRMLDGGCDPLYIARRVVRMAIEDIGLADPRAFAMTLEAWEAYDRLGSPEGELAHRQCRGLSGRRAEEQCRVRGDGRGEGGRRAIRHARRAGAIPQRADAADERAGARRRAIAMRTTSPTPTLPANATCPMSCRIGDTIGRFPEASRSRSAKRWRDLRSKTPPAE